MLLSPSCRYPRVSSIPACAGEPGTPGGRWPPVQRGSIPGVCGGTQRSTSRSTGVSGAGLSPRVRGNPISTDVSEPTYAMRSIPACAGEPQDLIGKFEKRCYGSIPACAGEPRYDPRRRVTQPGPVYPRVCGGTGVIVMDWRGMVRRSIPACAGEPCIRVPAWHGKTEGSIPRVCGGTLHPLGGADRIARPVYPRVCGGTLSWLPRPIILARCGLSPRVRGNRPRVQPLMWGA